MNSIPDHTQAVFDALLAEPRFGGFLNRLEDDERDREPVWSASDKLRIVGARVDFFQDWYPEGQRGNYRKSMKGFWEIERVLYYQWFDDIRAEFRARIKEIDYRTAMKVSQDYAAANAKKLATASSFNCVASVPGWSQKMNTRNRSLNANGKRILTMLLMWANNVGAFDLVTKDHKRCQRAFAHLLVTKFRHRAHRLSLRQVRTYK